MSQGKSTSHHVSLTEGFVRRLRPAAATAVVDYYDTNTSNLSLRLRPPSKHHRNGLLSWRYGYRYRGKPDVITIGHFPEWSPSMAHARAREARVALDRGLDPREALFPNQAPAPGAASRQPIDLVRLMFRRYEPELDIKSGNHRRNVEGYFRRFILPAWGERDIHTLTRREIVDLLKTVKDNSGPVSANRCATAISAWLNFLVKDGVLEASPARALPKSEEKERQRSLSLAELVLVWQAAERLGGPAGWFVQLLIATATRRDEAAELPRAEIDGDTWLLPANRNKSGRDFLIPLSTLARRVLGRCPDTGRFYFSTTGQRPISGFTRLKQALDAEIDKLRAPEQMPLPHWTFHDVRRGVRTALSALKVDNDLAERLLNHSEGKLRRTYDTYGYREEKAAALQLWADHFGAALAASSPTKNPEVLAAAD
jgi:hypothetical protein